MDTLAPPTVGAIDKIPAYAWRKKRSALFEHDVYRILGLLGLKTPTTQFLRDASEITPPE